MSDSITGLRRKIDSASDLHGVVRTMKTLAASSIGQYQKSVAGLDSYLTTVELGLGHCLRQSRQWGGNVSRRPKSANHQATIGAIVFGSDQGLVGQFNDSISGFAAASLKDLTPPVQLWAVGERVHTRLSALGLQPKPAFAVPLSVSAISQIAGRLLLESVPDQGESQDGELHLFYNGTQATSGYGPVHLKLLPLDEEWRERMLANPWPTKLLPEVIGSEEGTLRALIREYLFISIFRACAESLASENASRLAAMQRAEKSIDDLIEVMGSSFHKLRQSEIDEELFDVISGFEALRGKGTT